jgi:hypothetical protein
MLFIVAVLELADCLTLEDGTDALSRNVGRYQPAPRKIPEGRRSLLRRGGSLKLCITTCVVFAASNINVISYSL